MTRDSQPVVIRLERQQLIPATVLGCLQAGFLTVEYYKNHPQADGGIQAVIPVSIVPIQLRVPNSEFFVVLDIASGAPIGVRRQPPDATSR